MAIRVSRNQAGGHVCDNCGVLTSCASWTVFSNDGRGWAGTGTVHVCRPCLLEQGAALDGMQHVTVQIAVLKDAGVVVPHNAKQAELADLMAAHGLAYPGTDARVGGLPAPRRGTRDWWIQEAGRQGVPLITDSDGDPLGTIEAIETRCSLWARATALGLQLPAGVLNAEAMRLIEGYPAPA